MSASVISIDTRGDEEPETSRPKPTQANKRPRADSSPSDSSLKEKTRKKSRSKKKKKTSQPPNEPSDSEATTKTNLTRDSDDSDSNEGGGTLKNARRTAVAMEKRLQNEPKAELAACIQRIKASKSDAYHAFEKPKLMVPEPGLGYSHYTFKCKSCGELVKRKIGSMETLALLGHITRCDLKRKQQMLVDYGITAASGPPTAYQTREYCALIVCEHARPQLMFKDRYLRKLIPRETVKHLPHRTTITQDILTMYRMTQRYITSVLADIPGVFHAALDMYQSPNGFDYLGIVLFHQEIVDHSIRVKRFVLECLNFDGSHTGKALANKVHKIFSKFEIQDRVWGIVCDNATNNDVMMDHFTKLGMARLEGPECRVHCMAHILNLAAQAILSQFTARRNANGEWDNNDGDEDGDSDDDCDEEELAGADLFDDEDFDHDDDGTAPSHALDPDPEELEEEEEEEEDDEEFNLDFLVPSIVVGSDDEKELRKVRDALKKSAWFANKLRRSTRTKASFKLVCVEKGVPLPHNLRRDVKTRWNSTAQLLQDSERLFPAILTYQASQNYPRNRRLTKDELRGIRILLGLLKPLEVMTKVLSRSGVPMLGSVIAYYDSLNHEYSAICQDTSRPLWARRGADCARRKFNKYYQKTDQSNLYRAGLLTHPSFRRHYMEDAEWPQEWIDEAVAILQECWEKHYKPVAAPSDDTDSRSEVSYSSYMDQMCARLDGMSGLKEADPVVRFIKSNPIFERSESGRSIPVNPLSWWYSQRLAGEEHDGLTQMAIDIHTTPATSVDVERAFSFVSALVSKRRHKLGALTIQASASLGAYSRADLVQLGCLKRAQKLKAKKKAQEAQRRAEAEAETIVVDDGQEGEDEGADEDEDEDEDEGELEDEAVRKRVRKKLTSSSRKPSMNSQKVATSGRKGSTSTKKASTSSRKPSTSSKL